MGYTHYWRQNHTINDEAWTSITTDAAEVIKLAGEQGVDLRDGDGENGSPSIDGLSIILNGDGDDSHETFALSKTGGGFDFCKTARKPYDAVVTAILCIVGYHDKGVKIFSDGDLEEWSEGLALARMVRPLRVNVPF